MPRELTTNDCRMSFYDRLSDSDLELFYRMPTTKEQVDYENSIIKRERNKITSNIGDARITYGRKILTGIGDNSFTREKNGKIVPLHSREDSEYYDPKWKDLVVGMASDVVSKLAFLVFEGSLEQTDGDPGAAAEDPS